MKKIYTLLFFVTTFLSAQAQYGTINSMTIIPPNPTTIDTVKLIGDITVGYMNCPLANSTVTNLSPGNYMVEAFYCMGMLTALCGSIDTFTIGVLPAGTNNIYMTLYSDQWVGPNTCDVYAPLDTDVVQIFVSTSTGIPDEEITPLRIVTEEDGFSIKGERLTGSIDVALYSITGSMIFNKTLSEEENKIDPTLSPGIYFYRLRVGKDFYYGKLFAD